MITIHLSGGLGNQLFQFATGYSVAKKNQTGLILNISAYKNNIRSYELNNFKKIASFCELDNAASSKNKFSSFLRHKFFTNHYVEKHPFKYSDSIKSCRNGVNLYGYFQSERYFIDSRSDLLYFFSFDLSEDFQFNKFKNMIQTCASVSLHVRRGDYLSNHAANSYHGILSIEYYKKAVNIISNQLSDPVFFIFSDDLNWAAENLRFISNRVLVDCNRDRDSYRDVQLMSLCHSNVIANSSFSWWGAWLNKNQEKIVVAPKRWVIAPEEPLDDIIPRGWIGIDNE